MSALQRIQEINSFYVRQKLNLITNIYDISTLGPDGKSPDELLCHVRQKGMKIREEINFFTDSAQTHLLMRIKAKKIFEFRGRSEVQLADGTVIGQLQKVFGRSLFRSTWEVLDPTGKKVIATAREQSILLAFLRRIWSEVPYIGNIPFFIPFHFEILIGDSVVGYYRRPIGFSDRYILDLSGDTNRYIDRRVALAFTVALDALQDR